MVRHYEVGGQKKKEEKKRKKNYYYYYYYYMFSPSPCLSPYPSPLNFESHPSSLSADRQISVVSGTHDFKA